MLNETRTFRPDLINELRVSYSRLNSLRSGPKVQGATSTDVGMTSRFIPDRRSLAVNADVKWVRSGHTISFGGLLQRSHVDLATAPSIPYMRFDNSINGYAIFLMGYPLFHTQSTVSERLNAGWFPTLYVQDDVRVTPRLTRAPARLPQSCTSDCQPRATVDNARVRLQATIDDRFKEQL